MEGQGLSKCIRAIELKLDEALPHGVAEAPSSFKRNAEVLLAGHCSSLAGAGERKNPVSGEVRALCPNPSQCTLEGYDIITLPEVRSQFAGC